MANDDEVSFDVYVVDENDNPVAGEEVTAFFTYSFWPGCFNNEYTDEDGHASFSSTHPSRPLEVELHARGAAQGKYPLEDGDSFTIQI